MSGQFTPRFARASGAALFASVMLAGAAQAQDRNLDTEPSAGKIFSGDLAETDKTTQFALTLRAGQAVDLTAAPVDGADPYLRVYDARSDALLAENDDSDGLGAHVQLYSEETKRLRIEVSNAAVDGPQGTMKFELIVRPSDYRPKPPLEIALGQKLSGSLAGGEDQLFRFHAERGQLWQFTMNRAPGSELDPAVEVFAGNSAAGDALASDDDSGGGLDARVRFLVPTTGDYVARGYAVTETGGDYVFVAGQAVPAKPAELLDIDVGRPASDTIDADVPVRFYRLSPRARSAIAAAPGAVVVELNHVGGSDEGALDPVLDVGFETPLGFSSVLNDDDSGGDTDARILLDASTLTPTWLEALRIRASGFLQTEGEYELTLRTDIGD
ncbi:MAG: hypothetical protein ABIT16_05485 [Croceibacterium sp.]